MKMSTPIAFGVAASGVLFVVACGCIGGYPSAITTETSDYQKHSPGELAADNILDLNTASRSELLERRLGHETFIKYRRFVHY